jgi:hypothetical protein
MSRRFNLLRTLRLQLKSGYRLEEPREYQFLKKLPPYNHVNAYETHEVPYIRLLKKAMKNNPNFGSEGVYPAYGNLEPQALTLAKKQYLLMKQGLSEEEAYAKAMEYVVELEDKAYNDLKFIHEEMKKMQTPKVDIMTEDKNIEEKFKQWQEKLRTIPYDELPFEEQGELDEFIQCKLLKWNQVQRERRMKDIVFYLQYRDLLEALFPLDPQVDAVKRQEFQEVFTERFLQLYGVNREKLITSKPFYVEDYLRYLQLILSTPNLRQLSQKDNIEISKWITETLAYQDILDARSLKDSRFYLTSLQNQFFPMFKLPSMNGKFKIPGVEEIKRLLYENDVGYQRRDGKLYVRRFYKLPMLLFPTEVCCALIAQDKDTFK